MITLNEITKKIGSRVLFEDVTLTFNTGKRYGLTGPNGAGKSTLMKIMMGIEPPTSGSVSLPRRVGFLRQNIEDYRENSVLDTVIMGNARLWETMTERDMLYEKEMTDAIGMRLGELEEVIAEEDGYSADSAAETLLVGMGIELEFHGKLLGEIPTGLQFRVMLCQALFGDPEALLLDEPTNHLDMESIGWLEGFLHAYTGTLIVISHDRHFLNSITTDIADIDYETLIIYPGNYDSMIVAKSQVRSRTEAENKTREKKVSQLKEFVAKFGAGTRASQVQSRLREINKLQPQELKKSNIDRPYIRFSKPEKQPGKMILKVDKLAKAYDENQVIKDFSIEILRGEKIGVIGNNGRGKTTLLKMLSDHLAPDAGKIELGHMANIGYFPQNHSEAIDKSTDVSAFDWLKGVSEGLYDQEVRGALGKMLFSGDDAFKSITKLSGGETARLLFAGLMLREHNTLILDEPNNHLDLESVSALSWGLEQFDGTVLVASHDRDLLSSVCTRIIALEKDGIHIHMGGLEEYFSTHAK